MNKGILFFLLLVIATDAYGIRKFKELVRKLSGSPKATKRDSSEPIIVLDKKPHRRITFSGPDAINGNSKGSILYTRIARDEAPNYGTAPIEYDCPTS